ncbi:Crp/Fnr family transcriptional regulator [Myxococcota bacterium]|nr:Crp/Fnr family transcriptional regulator [Myxococcota bacterium]MBU1379589.1 Crp/Fnr family transcriptional regulator [Myxococcota bacterium]MBU1498308.1 Crp/Fnr family transcriptional regulator [Myxococcota bacterium]
MRLLKQHIDFPSLLRRFSPFKSLSEPAIKDLEQRFVYRRYAAGAVISTSGKENDELFLIRSGKVHIYLKNGDGEDLLLHSLSWGDVFGQSIGGFSRDLPTEVKCIEETGMLVLKSDMLSEHIRKYPETSLVLVSIMSARLQENYETLACLSLGDVSSRLLRLLKRLGEKDGYREGDFIVIPNRFTQQEMAQMIGARRETVSRLLSSFVESNIISRKNRNLVLRVDSF